MTAVWYLDHFAARKIDIKPAPRASTVKTPAKNSSPNNPAIKLQEKANSPIAIDSRTFAFMALLHRLGFANRSTGAACFGSLSEKIFHLERRLLLPSALGGPPKKGSPRRPPATAYRCRLTAITDQPNARRGDNEPVQKPADATGGGGDEQPQANSNHAVHRDRLPWRKPYHGARNISAGREPRGAWVRIDQSERVVAMCRNRWSRSSVFRTKGHTSESLRQGSPAGFRYLQPNPLLALMRAVRLREPAFGQAGNDFGVDPVGVHHGSGAEVREAG
jgi:hypothetical protein